MDTLAFVYILTNNHNTVFYVGVTNNLKRRIWEHKQHIVEGFTKKYNICKLVYYEVIPSIKLAIQREKQIKGGSRKKKLLLIQSLNPTYADLYTQLS